MALTPTQRRRYARHTLLSEIGTVGQERLCAANATVNADADAAASSIARDYLMRAGVNVLVGGECTIEARVATANAVDQFAPTSLRHAAATLAGAFAAVETIKHLVGAGRPAQLPATFRLIVEES